MPAHIGITQMLQLVPVWWNDRSILNGGMGGSYRSFVKQSKVIIGRDSNILTDSYDDYRQKLDRLGDAGGALLANGRKAKNYAQVFGNEWELCLKAETAFDYIVKQFIDEGWLIVLVLTVSSMQGLQRANNSQISRPLKMIEARKNKKIVVLWSLAG